MKRIFIACGFLVALAACQSPEVALLNSCTTAGGAVNMLTGMKAQGRLTTEQIETVNTVVDTLDPICGAAEVPSVDAALAIVERQILIMNGVIFPEGGS